MENHLDSTAMEMQDKTIQKVSIKLLRDICKTLAQFVSKSFGPFGTCVLLLTSTGKTVITSDGFQLLSAIDCCHPLAQYIIKCLQCHHSMIGDGSKTFVIYLSGLIEQIGCPSGMKKFVSTSSGFVVEDFAVDLSSKLKRFLQVDFVDIVKLFLKKLSGFCNFRAVDLETVTKNILTTSLHTSVSLQLSHFFANILWAMLSFENQNPTEQCVFNQLSYLLENFEKCVVKGGSHTLQSSRVLDGILLQCSINPCLWSRENSSHFRVVLVNFLSDKNDRFGKNTCVFTPFSEEILVESFFRRRTVVQKFLERLKVAQIDFILSVQKCPDYILSMCMEQQIAVVQVNDFAKVEFLQKYIGVAVLSEPYEPLEGTEWIFAASLCQKMQIENTLYILIKPYRKDEHKLVPAAKQIVLCAPSEGLYEQMKTLLHKAYKSLHSSFQFPPWGEECFNPPLHTTPLVTKSSHQVVSDISQANIPANRTDTVSVIGGGGMFEALLSSTIDEYYQKRVEPFSDVTAGMFVKEMLSTAIRRLYSNLSAEHVHNNQGHHFSLVWTKMLQMASQSCPVGIDEYGETLDTASAGTVEPLACKFFLVYQVVDLVQRLLRMEMVVDCSRPQI